MYNSQESKGVKNCAMMKAIAAHKLFLMYFQHSVKIISRPTFPFLSLKELSTYEWQLPWKDFLFSPNIFHTVSPMVTSNKTTVYYHNWETDIENNPLTFFRLYQFYLHSGVGMGGGAVDVCLCNCIPCVDWRAMTTVKIQNSSALRILHAYPRTIHGPRRGESLTLQPLGTTNLFFLQFYFKNIMYMESHSM